MNIYVANLSYEVNDTDLKDLFEEFGQVSSAKVIIDKMSGKSRGFGFVEMADNEQGQKAIQELDKCEYDGKVINVTIAKPRTDRPTGGSFSNRRGGGDFSSNRRTFRN